MIKVTYNLYLNKLTVNNSIYQFLDILSEKPVTRE